MILTNFRHLLIKLSEEVSPKQYLSALLLIGLISEAIYIATLYSRYKVYDHFDISDPYRVIANYKASLKNQQNDVLLIGDSSCMMGVRPKIIEELTGLKVVNLAIYAYSGPQAYDALLRRYLKRNKVPKLIIYYVSPSVPNIYNLKNQQKIYFCNKYFNYYSYISFFNDINPIFDFPMLVSYLENSSSIPNFSPSNLLNELVDEKGYNQSLHDGKDLNIPLPPDKVINSRDVYYELIGTKNDPLHYLTDFKRRFTTKDTKVLIYLAPMPESEASFNYYRQVYQNVADNEPYKLPQEYFRDYTHLVHAGANINSQIVAKFIKERI